MADREGDLSAIYAGCEVLAHLGIKDERIRELILKAFPANEEVGTDTLLHYDEAAWDTKAIEALARKLS